MKPFTAIVLSTALLFFSCQKVVTLKLKSTEPELVIQAEITNDPGPYTVIVNQTVDFYADNNFPPISGAIVKISDNQGASDSLTETSPGVYTTHTIQGMPGNTYTLSVFAQNTEYTAVSTMPQPVNLDSVTFETTSGFGQHQVNALANFQDPPGIKNYYQFREYINGVLLAKDLFIFQDRLSDGRYIDYNLFNDSTYLSKGDQLKVSMYCIDVNVFNYLYQLDQSSGAGANNNTASPANPVSNISNGALGYFSAHTTQSVSVEVP